MMESIIYLLPVFLTKTRETGSVLQVVAHCDCVE